MTKLLNLGPAEHEEVAIYTVNQWIPNVRELREQLRCEQFVDIKLGAKNLLSLTS